MQRNIFGIYLGGREEIKYLREGKRIRCLRKIKNQLFKRNSNGQILGKMGKTIWGRIKRIKNEG